jgi:hypothetical protein
MQLDAFVAVDACVSQFIAPAGGGNTEVALAHAAFAYPRNIRETMQLMPIWPTGEENTGYVNHDVPILDVKKFLQKTLDIGAFQQRWISAGKELDNAKTLLDHNIERDSNIVILLRLAGGGRNTQACTTSEVPGRSEERDNAEVHSGLLCGIEGCVTKAHHEVGTGTCFLCGLHGHSQGCGQELWPILGKAFEHSQGGPKGGTDCAAGLWHASKEGPPKDLLLAIQSANGSNSKAKTKDSSSPLPQCPCICAQRDRMIQLVPDEETHGWFRCACVGCGPKMSGGGQRCEVMLYPIYYYLYQGRCGSCTADNQRER